MILFRPSQVQLGQDLLKEFQLKQNSINRNIPARVELYFYTEIFIKVLIADSFKPSLVQ